ncbi:MAG TPA: CarD family transcriptional regulator, partial [Pyrinomonadaceae bacterium]|nr:CarD family transcriptional regulator [Pyrinomonadaceae bacterium]
MQTKIKTSGEIERLSAEISAGSRVISISGLTSTSAKAFVLASIQKQTAKNIVVITDSNKDAETWECDLDFWIDAGVGADGSRCLNLPAFETDVYSGVSPHAETEERRALSLWQILNSPSEFIVLPIKALISKTLRPDEMRGLGALLRRGEDFEPGELVERLVTAGYVRQDPLGNVGEFSMRGGIVDVWSPDMDSPVRIEFFGDTVDSIRAFDPESQLSTGQLTEVSVAPMREFAASPQDLKDWAFFAKDIYKETRFARNLKDRTDFADEGETFSGWEFHLPLIKPLDGSVFDYLDDVLFVVDEPALVEHTLSAFYESCADRFQEITEADDIGLSPDKLFLEPDKLQQGLENSRRIELRALGRTAARTDEEFHFDSESSSSVSISKKALSAIGENGEAAAPIVKNRRAPLFLFPADASTVEHEISSRPTRKYHGDVADFAAGLRSRTETPLLVMSTPGLAERLVELLREYGTAVAAENIIVGDLSSGFEIPSIGFSAYTEIDVFGETQQSDAPKAGNRPNVKKSSLGAFISDFRDLKSGDYVVHVDHGLGRFEALQTLDSGGIQREFMLLIYADEAKLFVPVERMDLVSRYSSGEATSPALDR